MTPKQKAEDLILSFSVLGEGQNDTVKSLCIIAVDQIENAIEWVKRNELYDYTYWDEVRKEIDLYE